MKSKLATAIVLGMMATGAMAKPTLYGAFDVSVDYLPEQNNNAPNRDVVDINSNNSFVGIKGEEELTSRLSAVYQADWTFYADGETSDFGNRTRFIGLKDKQFGTLKVGQIDTPLKNLSSAVDSFNNKVANKIDVTGIMTGENRISNSVVYESPAINLAGVGKLNFNILTATGEANGNISSVSGGYKVAGRGLGDAFSTSVLYTQADSRFLLGVGYDKAIPSRFLGVGMLNASSPALGISPVVAAADTVRVTGRVNLKEQGLALKALYQQSEVSDVNKFIGSAGATVANIDTARGWLLGAEWNIPTAKPVTAKLQYSANQTSFKNNAAKYKAEQIVAGVDYAFNKQAKVYGQAGYLTLKQGSAKDKQPLVGVGMEYKF